MCLERATIASGQGTSEDQKFVLKPPQLNMNLFFANGISSDPVDRLFAQEWLRVKAGIKIITLGQAENK